MDPDGKTREPKREALRAIWVSVKLDSVVAWQEELGGAQDRVRVDRPRTQTED